MNTVIKGLEEVKNFLKTEDVWTQGELKRPGLAPDGECQWCILGAIYHVILDNYFQDIAWNELVKTCDQHPDKFKPNPVAVNDQQGFEAIHSLLDLTIDRLKKKS